MLGGRGRVGVSQPLQDGPAGAAGERQVCDRDVGRTGGRRGDAVVARLVVGRMLHRCHHPSCTVERVFED